MTALPVCRTHDGFVEGYALSGALARFPVGERAGCAVAPDLIRAIYLTATEAVCVDPDGAQRWRLALGERRADHRGNGCSTFSVDVPEGRVRGPIAISARSLYDIEPLGDGSWLTTDGTGSWLRESVASQGS
jgi:hypothetical protein